ncbi:hypothetical protein VTK73DRAFT_271 [Phialemonium thermophilum]|uniref:Antigenic cell wall galactomannoprotein n=1 Tax=Phialemonium thermophilum TaxID=223376 RepID=A0ABR3XFL3_9PEZI
MLVAKLFSVIAVLVTTALADGAAIVSSLNTIASDTASLNNTVLAWHGDLLGALPIVTKSTELLSDINKGTKTAKASAPLSALEALSIALATQSLIQDVNATLTTIVGARHKFNHLLLGPIILLNLDLEKEATDKLTDAIKGKLPSDLVSVADQLAAEIDDLFDQAIDVYNGPF